MYQNQDRRKRWYRYLNFSDVLIVSPGLVKSGFFIPDSAPYELGTGSDIYMLKMIKCMKLTYLFIDMR
jgi:hypothetical protein